MSCMNYISGLRQLESGVVWSIKLRKLVGLEESQARPHFHERCGVYAVVQEGGWQDKLLVDWCLLGHAWSQEVAKHLLLSSATIICA